MTGTSNTAARAASRTFLSPRSGDAKPAAGGAEAPPAAPGGTTFCGNCGTKVDPEDAGAAFCGMCGSKLN